MRPLSSQIRITFAILSVNIRLFLWPFNEREASIDNLVTGTTGSRKKNVCLSGCLLMTTEGLLILVFWEVGAFLYMMFPGTVLYQFLGCSRELIQYFQKYVPITDIARKMKKSLMENFTFCAVWSRFGDKKFIDFDLLLVTLSTYFLGSIKLFSGKLGVMK